MSRTFPQNTGPKSRNLSQDVMEPLCWCFFFLKRCVMSLWPFVYLGWLDTNCQMLKKIKFQGSPRNILAKKNTHLTSPFLLPAVLRRLEHCSEDWPADVFFLNPKFCGGFGVLGSQNWIQKRKLTWKGTDTDEFPLANCKNARLANKNHCLPFVGGFISSPSSGLENRFCYVCLFQIFDTPQSLDSKVMKVPSMCCVFVWCFDGSS